MFEDYILEAIEIVGARDLPDEEFGQAVSDQARLMSGVNPDDLREVNPDIH
jgi:hypothetical protein